MNKIRAIKYLRTETGFSLEHAKRLVEGVQHELSLVPQPTPEAPTLRDMIAMQTLAGMLANPDRIGGSFKDGAEVAYHYADAMLAVRGGPSE